MKKLYDRDEVWFAVGWIVVYVLAFGNADQFSEQIGMPKLLTVIVGLLLSLVLYGFVRKNGLMMYLGLCPPQGKGRRYLWFIPLLAISSVNFWNGLTFNYPPVETLLFIVSMCFVGFLEEIIFRGLLFKGLCRGSVRTAILVSSLTFGAGHIVNLLTGAALFDTLLQLVYASAIGFCFTAFFHVSGSILPLLLSHAFINSTSASAVQPDAGTHILMTVIQTFLGVGYGLWLLRQKKENV